MKMKKGFFAAIFAAVILVSSCIPAQAAVNFEPKEEVYSQAALLVNTDTDTIIYEKNINEKIAPASLTKIMTVIIVAENIQDIENSKTVVKAETLKTFEGMGASNADLRAGEEIYIIDLLYATILRSACEGADVLADYVSKGNIPEFVNMMNAKCAELGAANTHFINTHGLDAEGQYTTAFDMYKITSYALKNELLKKIFTSATYEMPATNKHPKRMIRHTNIMLDQYQGHTRLFNYYDPRISGIKTGTTNDSGRSLITIASNNEYGYMAVTLKAPLYDEKGKQNALNYAFVDHKQLYTWAFNTFRFKTVLSSTDIIEKEIKVKLGKGKDYLILSPEKEVIALLPTKSSLSDEDVPVSSIQRIADVPDEITAPVQKGQIMGTLTLKLKGEELTKVNLVAGESIDRSSRDYIIDIIKKIVTSVWFWILIAFIIILVIIYIIITINYNRKRRRRNRVRKPVKYKR